MKKILIALAVAGIVSFSLSTMAADEKAAAAEKKVADMTVDELGKALKDKEAALAKADEAKKAEIKKSIDEIKAALEAKKAAK